MKSSLTIVFLFLTSFLFAQQNLVPNSGFEIYDTCPNSPGDIRYANGWLNMCNSTIAADYFNSCNNYSFSVPHNDFGYQFAANGNAYCGLVTYYRNWLYNHSNYREYIGSQLNNLLNIGQKYFLSIKVSLAIASCASNNIGFIFSTVPYNYNSFDSLSISTNNYTHLNCQSIITDTMNWTTISGSFIADSSYKYIIIGNFFDDSNTTITNSFNNCVAYYYLDDVCVSTDSLTCPAFINVQENDFQNEFIVFPNPATNDLTLNYSLTSRCEFELYDMTGAKRVSLVLESNSISKRINLSEFNNGLYYYIICDKNCYKLKTGKLIIQK